MRRLLIIVLLLACPAESDAQVRLDGALRLDGVMAVGPAAALDPLVSISVTPATPSIVNSTWPFTATGTYLDGTILNLSSVVTWTSGTPATGTIGTAGLFSTVATGSSLISASVSGVTGSTTATVAPTQSVSMCLATSTQALNSAQRNTIALPVWIPPAPTPAAASNTEVRLYVGNFVMNPSIVGEGTVTGVDLAIGTSDGTGTAYSGTPVTYLNQTIPGDGTYLVTPWTKIDRGSDGKLLIVYSMPPSFNYAINQFAKWGTRSTSLSAKVNPLPGGMTANTGLGYMMRIEFRTTAKRVVILGDSLVVGAGGASVGVQRDQTAWFLSGPNQGYAVDYSGVIGSKLTQWDQSTHYTDNQNYSGAVCFQEVGVNDLPTSTASQYETNVINNASRYKGLGCSKYYVQAMAPCALYAANEATRQAELTWLRAGGIANVDGILDADALLRDPSNHAILSATYDAGDGCHWNAAAHTLINTAFGTLIAIAEQKEEKEMMAALDRGHKPTLGLRPIRLLPLGPLLVVLMGMGMGTSAATNRIRVSRWKRKQEGRTGPHFGPYRK